MPRHRTVAFLAVLGTAFAQPVWAATLWIAAGQAESVSPRMLFGAKQGLQGEGALGDFLVPTMCSAADKPDTAAFAQFAVAIPQAGTYCVWARVRYPMASGESFGLVIGDEEKGTVLALADGRQVGRAWRWDSQGDGRLKVVLKPGRLTFRVTARQANATVYGPSRWRQAEPVFNPWLNLLCLTTDAAYVPNDADASRAMGLSRRREPPPRVEPIELPRLSAGQWSPGRQPIPDWLRCARWFTKDSWRSELAHREAGDIAYELRQVAACEANVYRLSVCWGADAYYQSRVAPHAPGLKNVDYLREAIDEGRRLGVRVVAYYNPNAMYDSHPLISECVIRNPDGRPSTALAHGPRFPGALCPCFNNPRYRRFVTDVVEEIFTKYGPDGLYVDGISIHTCFCQHCRAKYRAMFAAEMPAEKFFGWKVDNASWGYMESEDPLVGDPRDPDSRRLTAFLSRTTADFIKMISRTVKRCKPEAAATFHEYPKAETVAFYDGALTEIHAGRPWVHGAWKYGEMASYANVFPVPAFFNIYPERRITPAESRYQAFQGLANGVYPNFWSTVQMKTVFGFLRRNAEYYDFGRTTPVKYAAMVRLHWPDAAQKAAPRAAGVSYTPDRFVSPCVGTYSAMARSGLPVLTRHQNTFHRQLEGLRVIVLPNVALMSEEQLSEVRAWVRGGGGLVCTHETSLYDENGARRSDFGLADVLGVHYREVLHAAERPLAVVSPQHPVVARLGRGAIVQDQPHVAVQADAAQVLATLAGVKIQEGDSPAILINQFGKGRVVYLPGRPDAMQCEVLKPWIERLYSSAIRWAAQEDPPVELSVESMVGVTLFEQPGRRILHLVNYPKDTRYESDEFHPVRNLKIAVTVPAGRQARRVHRLWSPAEVSFTQEGNRVRFALDSLDEYEVVAVDFP